MKLENECFGKSMEKLGEESFLPSSLETEDGEGRGCGRIGSPSQRCGVLGAVPGFSDGQEGYGTLCEEEQRLQKVE